MTYTLQSYQNVPWLNALIVWVHIRWYFYQLITHKERKGVKTLHTQRDMLKGDDSFDTCTEL